MAVFLWLTVFQILAAIQLTLAAGEKASPVIPICFLSLTAVMWLYAAALRLGRCVGFELETIAFYLSTLSLAVTASSAPRAFPSSFWPSFWAWACFLALGLFLRDLERVKKRRWLMAAGAIGLLGITLVLGKAKFGATNWITLGGLSFQPSEIAKICYILCRLRHAGTAVPPPESDAVHRAHRRVHRPAGADERLRHGGHLSLSPFWSSPISAPGTRRPWP